MHSSLYPFTALKTHLEVSVELQLSDAETLNLTLYSGSNHSSLHLHPPGEDEEEEEEGSEDEGQRRVFYCCLPVPPAAESANPRHCLLWLANRMVWSATAQEKLPWKRSQRGGCRDERVLFGPRLVRRKEGINWPISFHFVLK